MIIFGKSILSVYTIHNSSIFKLFFFLVKTCLHFFFCLDFSQLIRNLFSQTLIYSIWVLALSLPSSGPSGLLSKVP